MIRRSPDGLEPPLALLCDPDDDTRAVYRAAMTGAGWRVEEACEGREALAKALDLAPTLVITEMRLPWLDGCALCERLRRDRLTCDVPILVLTADAYPVQVLKAWSAGADAVLVKPCLPDRVLREIERLRGSSGELRRSAAVAPPVGGTRRAPTTAPVKQDARF